MINKQLLDLTDQLKTLLNEQMAEAKKGIEAMPEGAEKHKMRALLRHARSGKLSLADAQKELNKILKDAGTN